MLIGLKNVSYRIGRTVLLDGANLSIEERERVALVGRNGTGKSTLFRLLCGEIQPEEGELICKDGIRLASLQQAVPDAQDMTIEEVVAEGLGELGKAILLTKTLAMKDHASLDTLQAQALEKAQTALTEQHAWHLQSDIDNMLARFELDGQMRFGALSGGMKRKVMLAKAMVSQPDVLLLDEPTNHLDIQGIELLENLIRQFTGSVVFVSHDRAFMRKLATRVCDLDRGLLKTWSGGYEGYLKGKAEFLAAEEKQDALFDKRLAEEEVWIRRGIEARRTRNEGRVRALLEMRKQYADRRKRVGQANVEVHEASRSGKIVAEIENVSLKLGELQILQRFSTVLMRGDKVGVIGPNGIGKTTALKVILGQLTPDEGTLKLGTKLEIAYFDQLRSQFNEDETAVDVIGAGKEFIHMNGQAKHVMGYLQDFLFTPDRARQPVRSLSGGERARLLLAQLFAKPSNVLVLDEPTNDLDIETLELLEERLSEYSGTVLLVSHDREFLDQIVTRCLVFEGRGVVSEYVGGYSDWINQRKCDPWQIDKTTPKEKSSTKDQTPACSAAVSTPRQAEQTAAPAKKKLSYKESRELESLPETIEKLEAQQADLLALISDPNFYSKSTEEVTGVQQKMAKIEAELEHAYARWEELDG